MTSVTAEAKLSIAGSVTAEDPEVNDEFAREVEDEREDDSEAALVGVLAAVAEVVVALLTTGPVGAHWVVDTFTGTAFGMPGFFFSFAISVFFHNLLLFVLLLSGFLYSSVDNEELNDCSISSIRRAKAIHPVNLKDNREVMGEANDESTRSLKEANDNLTESAGEAR